MIIKTSWLVRISLITLLQVICFNAQAGWVDDWITQKTISSPSSANLAGMGVATFGQVNARWSKGSGPTPLLGFTRPKLKAGCGGLDIRLGGAWFAGIDYLVQKLQSLISNAAAVMFDVALSTISEQLNKAVGKVDQAVQFINKLSFDECALAKNFIKELGVEKEATATTQNASEAAANQNATASPAKANQDTVQTNTPLVAETTTRNECPTIVQNLLPTGNATASLLKNMLDMTSIPDIEDVTRGLIGDFLISKNTNNGGDTYVVTPITSCYKNTDVDLNNITEGGLKKRSATGPCSEDDDASEGTRAKVGTLLMSIANKLKTNTALTTAEDNFIKSLPTWYQTKLQGAILNGTSVEIAKSLTPIIADYYSYKLMDDLYKVVIKTAKIFKAKLTDDPVKMQKCKIHAARSLPPKLIDWSKKMYLIQSGLRDEYSVKVNRLLAGSKLENIVNQEYELIKRNSIQRSVQ